MGLKRRFRAGGGLLVGLGLICSCLQAHPPQLEMGVYSRYIWRGFDLNPDNRPVLQPSMSLFLGKSGLTLNLWGSFSMVDRDLDEVDLTLTWDFAIGERFDVTLGAVQYGWYFSRDFSWREHTSRELFFTIATKNAALNPSLSLYWDTENGSGLYMLLGITHTAELCCGRTLELGASIGYNHRQWVDMSGFSDLNVSISMPQRLFRVTITPSASVSVILMDAINVDSKLEIWGGILFSWDA